MTAHTHPTAEQTTREQFPVSGAPDPVAAGGPTIEVVGRLTDPGDIQQHIALEMAVAEAVLPHQLHEIDTLVEIAHLEALVDEKESRITLLNAGIGQWRERAMSEADARRREHADAHDRERDLIRVIHGQMTTIDTAEQTTLAAQMRVRELEGKLDEVDVAPRRRTRRWWRR
ncbi:MAG: hypothetical protein ACR2GX_00125 [Candidatus Dormibacteria bacterium]